MPNNNLINEEQIPANWEPVDSNPIVPGEAPKGAPAPPAPNDMPQFFQGSMPPALQLDVHFAGTETASPRVPKYSLMPLGTQSSAFTNAAAQSTAQTTVPSSPGSITLQVPNIFTPVSQTTGLPGPVIIALATQGANLFFAGPVSGAAAQPNFREIDAAVDITGILPVVNGGTGVDTLPANEVIYGNGTAPVGSVPSGTAGEVLTSNGSGYPPTFQAAGSGVTFAVKINGVGVSLDKQFFMNAVTDGSAPVWTVKINGTSDGG